MSIGRRPPKDHVNTNTTEHALKCLQKKNLDLAKSNSSLSLKLASASSSLLLAMEDKMREQEQRLSAERQLMEAMSALDVLKVEVGKRIPVMEAVGESLVETAGLFRRLLELDYGEILLERISSSQQQVASSSKDDRESVNYKLPGIVEEPANE
jgi:hypothetical protein